MNVQVEAPPEPLGKGYGAGLRSGHTGEALGRASDLVGEDAAQGRQHVGFQRGQAPKLERKREDPLSYRDIRQDAVRDGRSLVAHAAGPATRTETAALAGKGHKDVVPAGVAVASDEALRKITTEEVALEGVRYVARQRGAVRRPRVGEEGLVVLADETVEDGVVGSTGDVSRRQGAQVPHAACRLPRRKIVRSARLSGMAPPWRDGECGTGAENAGAGAGASAGVGASQGQGAGIVGSANADESGSRLHANVVKGSDGRCVRRAPDVATTIARRRGAGRSRISSRHEPGGESEVAKAYAASAAAPLGERAAAPVRKSRCGTSPRCAAPNVSRRACRAKHSRRAPTCCGPGNTRRRRAER